MLEKRLHLIPAFLCLVIGLVVSSGVAFGVFRVSGSEKLFIWTFGIATLAAVVFSGVVLKGNLQMWWRRGDSEVRTTFGEFIDPIKVAEKDTFIKHDTGKKFDDLSRDIEAVKKDIGSIRDAFIFNGMSSGTSMGAYYNFLAANNLGSSITTLLGMLTAASSTAQVPDHELSKWADEALEMFESGVGKSPHKNVADRQERILKELRQCKEENDYVHCIRQVMLRNQYR